MFINRQKGQDETRSAFLGGILDSQDIGILVVDNNCNILLMNSAARSYWGDLGNDNTPKSCTDGLVNSFPSLCRHCPVWKSESLKEPADYNVQDKESNYYSVRYNSIEWIDKTPATVIFLRNINDERITFEKLNSLAYTDQLTGIPNRRKLMDDFESIAEKIPCVTGVLAIFDMDNFKAVNDSYGHNTGDVLMKRLADYFENDDALKGHLYRLGGDEFVLLFVDFSQKILSLEECRNHFDGLLKSTLRSYSLPNIELSCTLSMGVALFPWQGENFSELLRKADVALYKAKESGRNQICYFEEIFDPAKKLKDVFISMQPMLNQKGNTYGYELVDQGQKLENVDNSLELNEFDRTIDVLGLDDLESKTLYFISYSNQLLNSSVAKHLPKDKFVVKIQLADHPCESDYKKYNELSSLGYSIAFSGVSQLNATPEIFRLAQYCFFDPMETDLSFRRSSISKNTAIKFVAEGVDSRQEYETAKEQGCALFQGYFFSQPELVKKTKEIDPLKINYLQLLKLTSTDDYVDFQEISSIISADVALSYKLLRLLNSAAVGLRKPISSISLAIIHLGEINLKKWIAILALRGLSEDKPVELIRLSLIRAQFGEKLYRIIAPKRDLKHVFLVGMLSLLDVALEKSKEEVFKEIVVADEIQKSLLTDDGPFSNLVKFFSDYEHAKWKKVSLFALKNRLTDHQITNSYITSVKWYNDLVNFRFREHANTL